MKRFENQVAVITGGARGIGQAIGQRIGEEGGIVFLLDVLEDAVQATAHQMRNAGYLATGQRVDITNETEVKLFVQQIIKEKGRIDILVNCAGIIGHTATKITDYDLATFQRVQQVNLIGAFLITKYVIGHMEKAAYGRILHISSIGGKEGNPGMVGYAASKSGMMGLVKGVGKEFADKGITVNGLAPAVIATPMNQDTDKAMLDYMASKIPMGRLGTVDEAAAISCWIVSKEASFNTGFIFDLSGGRATF